jgi:hypothetical protein
MDDQTRTPPDTPIHSLEGGLFGTIFGFHQKVMGLLRAANLPDDKLGVASERVGQGFGRWDGEVFETLDIFEAWLRSAVPVA